MTARGALADQVQAAAAELFGHLPADELDDDEPLEVSLDAPGAELALRSRAALYVLRCGVVWRYQVLLEGESVVAFRDGSVLAAAQLPEGSR